MHGLIEHHEPARLGAKAVLKEGRRLVAVGSGTRVDVLACARLDKRRNLIGAGAPELAVDLGRGAAESNDLAPAFVREVTEVPGPALRTSMAGRTRRTARRQQRDECNHASHRTNSRESSLMNIRARSLSGPVCTPDVAATSSGPLVHEGLAWGSRSQSARASLRVDLPAACVAPPTRSTADARKVTLINREPRIETCNCDADARVREIAAPGAVDCGRARSFDENAAVSDCVLDAMTRGEAFAGGWLRQGIDSEVRSYAVEDSDGTVWMFGYDTFGGGSASCPSLEGARCTTPLIRETSTLDGTILTCDQSPTSGRILCPH